MWTLRHSAIFLVLGVFTAFSGCGRRPLDEAKSVFSEDEIAQGIQLVKTYCNTCHGVDTRGMDAMLAPPLIGIRDFYIERYPQPEAFVDAIASFTREPKRDDSLMPFAVKEFGLKAPVSLPEADLRLTAIALYAEQVERPVWLRDYRKAVEVTGAPK